MLGVLVVRVLEVDTVVLGGYCDRLVPLTARLVKLAEEVVAAALLVQLFSVIKHIKLDRHHSKSRFQFLFILSLSGCFGSSSKSHVA